MTSEDRTMERIIVQYKVKAGRVAENEAHISRVFERLREQQPPGIRYASLKLKDGVSFIHFVSIETADGFNPLDGVAGLQGVRRKCR